MRTLQPRKERRILRKVVQGFQKELLHEGLLRQITEVRLRCRACLRKGGKEEIMIENMAKRLSGILNKYKLPIALQISINKTITDEICKLCAETADTVRMIDIWTLLEGMGFTNEQVEEFAEKAQENYSDAYGTYGLDAVFKLRQILAERGIKYGTSKGG